MKKYALKNNQDGVSLIITFFVLTVMLSIVLFASAVLHSEIKIIRSMGNSTVAFFAAESGVEKVLYYDRKVTIDENRGFCNMCNPTTGCPVSGTESESALNCIDCRADNSEKCPDEQCGNCFVRFTTELNDSSSVFENKTYAVNVWESKDQGESEYHLNILSEGEYSGTARAIKIITK